MAVALAVTGSIGAGKTTLAARLATEAGAELLSSDAVRAQFSPNQFRSGSRVFDEMRRRFELALRERRDVILDSTGMSHRFRALLRAHRGAVLHVHLLLNDPQIFAERERTRSDRENGPLPYAAFRRSQCIEFHDTPDLIVTTDRLGIDALYELTGSFLALR